MQAPCADRDLALPGPAGTPKRPLAGYGQLPLFNLKPGPEPGPARPEPALAGRRAVRAAKGLGQGSAAQQQVAVEKLKKGRTGAACDPTETFTCIVNQATLNAYKKMECDREGILANRLKFKAQTGGSQRPALHIVALLPVEIELEAMCHSLDSSRA